MLDTVTLAQHLLPNLNRYKLDTVAKALNVSLENHHRAVDDAGATAEIFAAFVEMLKDRGVEDVDQLNAMSQMSAEMIKKMPTYHVIILADSDEGRVNLYRLVSFSHPGLFCQTAQDPQEPAAEVPEGADHRLRLRGRGALPGAAAGSLRRGHRPAGEFLRLPGDPAPGQQCLHAEGREEHGEDRWRT